MYKSLSFFILSFLLISCQNDMEELLNSDSIKLEQSKTMSIASSDYNLTDSIELLQESNELMFLKQQYQLHKKLSSKASALAPDDFFSDNMYAIREMPITIKVRSIDKGSTTGYNYMFVDGKGKEVVLRNSETAAGSKFYI